VPPLTVTVEYASNVVFFVLMREIAIVHPRAELDGYRVAGCKRPVGDQVPVGGACCGELVVAVLEILFVVEQLLLKFGDSFPQVFDFIGSGEAWPRRTPRSDH
jgi:hypothetical protein